VSRSSPFRIVLTSEEQERLEARARKYTSPYRNVVHAGIAQLTLNCNPAAFYKGRNPVAYRIFNQRLE